MARSTLNKTIQSLIGCLKSSCARIGTGGMSDTGGIPRAIIGSVKDAVQAGVGEKPRGGVYAWASQCILEVLCECLLFSRLFLAKASADQLTSTSSALVSDTLKLLVLSLTSCTAGDAEQQQGIITLLIIVVNDICRSPATMGGPIKAAAVQMVTRLAQSHGAPFKAAVGCLNPETKRQFTESLGDDDEELKMVMSMEVVVVVVVAVVALGN
eukprot:CAMPEP_0197859054 /NCGR_PEP_ID=MMETSP1438-20131217/33345_1 /TAXON_ID=1461541 /ORGANISM="Pterosperma sp., Strain CCMP1384" /LENGTH=211 /DNA_ID=CAMNT_0043475421 /DNA_START=53 /DNA_END=686 /DNA_ORIENTATION=-